MFKFFKKKSETTVQNDFAVEDKKPLKEISKTEFEQSIEAAQNGNLLAAAHVGVLYHYGIEVGDEEYPNGLEPNYELAIKYLTMAANKNYLKSQIDLGLIYLDTNSPVYQPEKGLEWLTTTAKKGDAFSQYVIGHHYNIGELLPKDEEKAYYWLLESAFNGCEGAMEELACIYNELAMSLSNNENYTEEDRQKSWENAALSFKWYKMAADLGKEDAMFFTAVYYFSGFGVDVDKEKALYYIDLAIENGCEAAINFKCEHFAQEDV